MRERGDGKLLAFCRSGNRSTLAWARGPARGRASSREELERALRRAPAFDLGPVAHLL